MANNAHNEPVDGSESTQAGSTTPAPATENSPVSRRSLRPLASQGATLAQRTAQSASKKSALAATHPASGNTRTRPEVKTRRRRNFRTVIIALAVPALFGTVALPAYASFQATDLAASSSAQYKLTASGAQSLTVDESVTAATVSRDGYSATTVEELATARAAAQAATQRQTFATTVNSDKSPSASDLLANPPYPTFSLDQVYQVALQYQGVPYVFGGATPAGFDCSGFVKYVFAQFGVDLPHSSTAQGNLGTRIAWEDAVPGDLVVRPGHIGFYAGNDQMLHASQPGVPLRISPIYQKANSWVVRIGI